ncbi:uncharacterized protein V1516DRAFT_669102 [Lipomyces oligophaga]|uniref:uncharacterized protein n=1 Tax=Lipomyces oligophaga TaxID=45792 RepID=UPI0034CD3950
MAWTSERTSDDPEAVGHPLEGARTAETVESTQPPSYGSTSEDLHEEGHEENGHRDSEDSITEEDAPLLNISADDPAVSPFRHFKIRTIRRLTYLFLVFSIIMYLLFIISTFFTIPKLNTHGGNFLIMMDMLIAIGNLGISLQSFAIPTKSGRIMNLVMIGFLLLNLILVVSVNKLRNYEGNVFSVLVNLWLLFSVAWIQFCNYMVERSRVTLEVQVSGHEFTGASRAKKSWKMWFSLVWALIVLAFLLALVVLLTLSILVDSYDSRLSPPGKYVQVEEDLYRIHIYCSSSSVAGNETDNGNYTGTTILLEPGSVSAETFARSLIVPEVAEGSRSSIENMRYCYWDRPGLGFSDNAPSPMSAGMAIDALSDGLNAIGEHGPWILVSEGLGTTYSRIFASRHSGSVTGLVIIDGYDEQYYVNQVSKASYGFGYWMHGFISPLGIDKQLGWIFGGRTSADRVYGRSQSVSGKYNLARFQEQLAAKTFTKNEIIAAADILPRYTPVAIISSQAKIREIPGWADRQRALYQGGVSDANVAWEIVENGNNVWDSANGRHIVSDIIKQTLEYSA